MSQGFRLGNEVSAASLTRVATIATFVAKTEHGFRDGQLIAIESADQPEYNIDAPVIIINRKSFWYLLIGAPETPATGSDITASSGPITQ